MPMGPMGVVARATDAKLGANGVVFRPGFDGTTPAPPNPEKSIIFFFKYISYIFLYSERKHVENNSPVEVM